MNSPKGIHKETVPLTYITIVGVWIISVIIIKLCKSKLCTGKNTNEEKMVNLLENEEEEIETFIME